MAEALISGTTGTGNITSARKKKDIAGGPKRTIAGFSCPVIKRGKKKKIKSGM